MPEALDYAARGERGLAFHSGRGELARALPYRTLREEAVRFAHGLLAIGFVPGDRLALVAETDADFVVAFCGAQYAGVVPAPLPLPTTFGGKQGYLDHVRRMVSTTRAAGVLAPAWLEGWVGEACGGLDLKVAGARPALADGPSHEVLPVPDPDAIAYLQFSSGSTRFPLGVAVTHRALMANARAITRHGLAVADGDRGLSWLPFYHDMGLVGFLLAPIAAQISVDYLATRDFARRPLLWLRLMSRLRATLSYSPSFGYEMCARRAQTASTEGIELSAWRAAGIGGDMIRAPVLERFADTFAPHGFDRRAFVASYGLAETTLAISFAPLGRGIEVDRVDMDSLERGRLATRAAGGGRTRDLVRCGVPIPDHAIEVRDNEQRPLPDRRVGRVHVRGPSLMAGYVDRPEETAGVLSADGWLDTGDLGYRDGQHIVITGRVKDLIIVNGRNIAPQDLEWSAEKAAGLRSGDVVSFSVDDGDSERVVLLVQCRPLDPATRERIRAEVAGLVVAEHGVEAEIVLVPPDALPQTSSGKLSRGRARQLYGAGAFRRDLTAVAS